MKFFYWSPNVRRIRLSSLGRVVGFFVLVAAFPLHAQEASLSSRDAASDQSVKKAAEQEQNQILKDSSIAGQTLSEDAVPLSIQDALAKALAANLDIALSRIEPALAETEILQAKDRFDPSFDLQLTYGESSSPRSAEQIAADGRASTKARSSTGEISVNQTTSIGTKLSVSAETRDRQNTFNDFDDEFSSFIGIEARQPLLKNFGTTPNLAELRITRKGKASADKEFIVQVESIIQDVYDAYFDLIFAISDLESRQESLKLAYQTLKDNQARVELGVMTPLDVSQARAEIAARQSGIAEGENLVSQNRNQLIRLISQDAVEWLRKQIRPTDTLQQPVGNEQILHDIAVALVNRNDYKALLDQAEQNKIRLAFAENQRLPQLDLTSSFGYNGLSGELGESFKNISETRDERWTIGMVLTIPWGDYGEKGRYQAAELQKKRTLLRIKKLEQDIIVEVDNAVNRVASAIKALKASRSARIFAEENAKAEATKLKEGSSTSFVVLQLQRDALLGRTRELQDLTTYNKALIALQKSQGILLRDNGITLEPASIPRQTRN